MFNLFPEIFLHQLIDFLFKTSISQLNCLQTKYSPINETDLIFHSGFLVAKIMETGASFLVLSL